MIRYGRGGCQKRKKWKTFLGGGWCIPVLQLYGLVEVSVTGVEAADYGISRPQIDENGISTWDCIYFGKYWQNDTNGDGISDENDEKEPIKWRVVP